MLIGIDQDSRLPVDLEAGRFDRDGEGRRRQIREGEEAFVIGGDGSNEAVCLAGQRDLGIGDYRARRILDRSGKRAGDILRRQQSRQQQSEQQPFHLVFVRLCTQHITRSGRYYGRR